MFSPELRNNGSHHEEGDATTAKAVAMAVLFIASFSIGTSVIQLNKWFKWSSNPKENPTVNWLLGFGGGVLFCTTFMHLVPEVNESFEELNLTPDVELHYAFFLMCLGFFIMYLVEECVHWYIERKEMGLQEKVLRRSVSLRSNKLQELESSLHDHHHHHHDHSHIIIEDAKASNAVKTLRGLLIVLALSVHELFEGLAVGLEGSPSAVWYMFGAVSAHKLVIAFCIGVELVTSGMKNFLTILYVFTFAIVSPMGIGIGMAVTNTQEDSTRIYSVILQGIASGTLLYVVFFEILEGEKKAGLRQFFVHLFIGGISLWILTQSSVAVVEEQDESLHEKAPSQESDYKRRSRISRIAR